MWRPSQNLARVGVEGSNPFARSSPTSRKLSPARSCTRENPSIGGLFGTRLECAEPERCGKSLSEARFLSAAWDLADLTLKMIAKPYQRPTRAGSRRSWWFRSGGGGD